MAGPGKSVQRIGVVILGILGDTLVRTPAVRELRKIFPKAQIECYVDPIGYEALQNSPDIDTLKVVIRSKKSKFRSLKSRFSVYCHLLTHSFDLFIDLYGNSSSKFMTRLAHASKEIVIANGNIFSRGLKPKIEKIDFQNLHHLSNGSMQILRYFWSDKISLDTRPVIDLHAKAMTPKEKIYLDTFFQNNKRFFVISAGSGDKRKVIPPRLCLGIAKFVAERDGATPALLYNPGTTDIQGEIGGLLSTTGLAYEVLPPLSIPAVTYLLQKALFIVVSDSGILHLTVAVGTPFLAIFPYTPPEEVVPQSGTYQVCFKPHPTLKRYGQRGLVYGDPQISDKDVLPRLALLLDDLKNPRVFLNQGKPKDL